MSDRMRITIDPAVPGVAPSQAAMVLFAVALVLVLLTLWTYLGSRKSSPRRVLIVLGLRLLALAVAVLLMLRPSIAKEETSLVDPSRLFFVVDASKSMTITDEFNSASRWQRVQEILASDRVQAALRKLADEKRVELTVFHGSDDLRRSNQPVGPDGKSTNVGRWLDELRREAGGDVPLQSIFVFSDGVDTGDPARTLQKASEFRGRWPIVSFGVGQPTTTGQDKDVALAEIFIEPTPILAKGKFKAKVIAQAPGFDNALADFSLWIEDRVSKTPRKIASRTERLNASDNTIVLEADAPDTDGEVKITVKAAPLAGETSLLNNEISTYAHVSKEGVRILWVEGRKRAFEGVFAIRHALARDPRFHVVYVERGQASDGDPDPYRFDQTAYDVVVIGDVSASRFGKLDVFHKIRDRVQNKGMGLVMLGGAETFANSDWQMSAIADLFPVRFDQPGQIEGRVRVAPTPEGLQYILRLADDPASNQRIWDRTLPPLEGMTRPGTPDPRAAVFAVADGSKTPVLAGIVRGKGRALTFAGDTTWQAWRRTPEAVAAYERFWKQMMLWAAQQEESQGAVFVQLDERRVERPKPIAFRVGFRGIDVPNSRFTARIIGPRGEEYPIPVGVDPRGQWTPPAAGEYTFMVEGKGMTPLGKPVEGRDIARFVVIETDRELLRPAADHDFLERLSQASDGAFQRADERSVAAALEQLHAREAPPQTRVSHWPDWRRMPPSGNLRDQLVTLWNSTALAALLVYIACLCAEWYLRRRWGMV